MKIVVNFKTHTYFSKERYVCDSLEQANEAGFFHLNDQPDENYYEISEVSDDEAEKIRHISNWM